MTSRRTSATSLEREARLVDQGAAGRFTEWEADGQAAGAESGLRITLIDSAGRVRAESDVPEERVPVIENHANRPEVIAALQNGVGSNKRTSATIGEPLLYVAVRGGPGIVRVAARIPQVDRVVKRAQHSVLGAALLALVIGCILATIAGRSVARPLTQITGAARAIAQGAPPRFPRSTIPDVNALVRALREMNNQFGERFEALRQGKAESVAIVEAMAEGVIAADEQGAHRHRQHRRAATAGIRSPSPAARAGPVVPRQGGAGRGFDGARRDLPAAGGSWIWANASS